MGTAVRSGPARTRRFRPLAGRLVSDGMALSRPVKGSGEQRHPWQESLRPSRSSTANGTPVDWPAALIRDLLRAADFLPAFYGFGLVTMLCNRDFQRLGDLAAGTVVMYRDPVATTPPPSSGPALPPPLPLSVAEQRLLIDYAERGAVLNPARQAELAELLADLTGTSGTTGVERLRAHARWLLGEPA